MAIHPPVTDGSNLQVRSCIGRNASEFSSRMEEHSQLADPTQRTAAGGQEPNESNWVLKAQLPNAEYH